MVKHLASAIALALRLKILRRVFPFGLHLSYYPNLLKSGSFVILVNFQTEDSELVLVFTGSAFTNLA